MSRLPPLAQELIPPLETVGETVDIPYVKFLSQKSQCSMSVFRARAAHQLNHFVPSGDIDSFMDALRSSRGAIISHKDENSEPLTDRGAEHPSTPAGETSKDASSAEPGTDHVEGEGAAYLGTEGVGSASSLRLDTLDGDLLGNSGV